MIVQFATLKLAGDLVVIDLVGSRRYMEGKIVTRKQFKKRSKKFMTSTHHSSAWHIGRFE